jgi:hypothetical protein
MRQIILSIAVAFLTISCVNPLQSGIFLTTSSPNKTYTVEFTGNKRAPNVPFVDHETRFNLFKNGQPLAKYAFVDSYDWFDSDFAEQYPKHQWVSDSVLRFGSNIAESETSPDSVIVSNRTGSSIKYLKINAADMLFLFETPPYSKTKITVPRHSTYYVAAEGEFIDGKPIPHDGVNFRRDSKSEQALQYCISVEDSGLKIESLSMEGFNGFGNEKRVIAKTENCDF